MADPLTTLRQLSRADRTYRNRQAKADEARADRDALIVQAVRDGATQTEVARAIGVTVGRVNHLIPPDVRPGRGKRPTARKGPAPRHRPDP
ncbi:MAG TPA: hypothetical protein VMF14_23270 [Solirubrobacteraceae bacterium]|nr:hypothetical protein [Solirubrobacteraceae bacterium]